MSDRRRRLITTIFLLGLCAPLSASCHVPVGALFSPYQPVSAEPDRKEVGGVWTPDADTLTDMRERGGYDVSRRTRITLRDDGSCEVVNMPDWWNDGFGRSYRGLSSFSGRWELSESRGRWEINLSTFGTRRSIDLVERKVGGGPPYHLRIIVGDPDSGDEMIFVRAG